MTVHSSHCVTGDGALLVLHPFPEIEILTPAEFLNMPLLRISEALYVRGQGRGLNI